MSYLPYLDDKPPVVVSLTEPDGSVFTDPPVVADRFLRFYGDLYRSQCNHTSQEIRAYLNTLQFPSLNLEQVQLLEAPITTQDITMALSLAKSKAPGLDGLSLEFYTTYAEMLTPKLKTLFQSIFELGILPPSMQEAQIIVLPKPGKNPQHPESYRPISLLPVDIKILAKVLSSLLNTVYTFPHTPRPNCLCKGRTRR